MDIEGQEQWKDVLRSIDQTAFDSKLYLNELGQITLDGPAEGVHVTQFVMQGAREFSDWGIHHMRYPPFYEEIQHRAEKLLRNHQVHGIKISHKVFSAFMSKLRHQIEEDHQCELRRFQFRDLDCTEISEEFKDKMSAVMLNYHTSEKFFLIRSFVFPMSKLEVQRIFFEREFYDAFRVLGWTVAFQEHPFLSCSKRLRIIAKGFFRML